MMHTYYIAGNQILGSRENQEDAYRLPPMPEGLVPLASGCAVLADGMGGEQDGELASAATADAAMKALTENPAERRAVALAANEAVRLAKEEQRMARQAGSTLVGVRFEQGLLSWVSVGDSLLYLYRDGTLRELNKKHVVGRLLDERAQRGEISWESAQQDPDRSALYCAVCGDPLPEIDAPEGARLCGGDRVIVASDGLLSLGEAEIARILSGLKTCEPAYAVARLLEAVQQRDNPCQDNTTVIVLDYFCESEQTAAKTYSAPRLRVRDEGAPWKLDAASEFGDRHRQQDRIFAAADAEAALAVVIDGAGGTVRGEQAAEIALAEVESLWTKELSSAPSCAGAEEMIRRCLLGAHQRIVAETGGPLGKNSGKAVIALLYLSGGEACVANIGDSRVYMLMERTWKPMTQDDSLLALQLRAGSISEREAMGHPEQTQLTQALGALTEPKPHISRVRAGFGACFMLCCDGFWNQLPSRSWMDTKLFSSEYETGEWLYTWVCRAVKAGAGKSDNVSAVLLTPKDQLAVLKKLNPLHRSPRSSVLLRAGLVAAGLLAVASLAYALSRPDGTPPFGGGTAEPGGTNLRSGVDAAPEIAESSDTTSAAESDAAPVDGEYTEVQPVSFPEDDAAEEVPAQELRTSLPRKSAQGGRPPFGNEGPSATPFGKRMLGD